MPEFNYEALAPTGQRSQGILTAGNEREAMSMLDARGLFPIKLSPNRATVKGAATKRVKSRHTAAFYAQLADLLHSGVPLLRSLDLLERQTSNPALAQVIREVRAKVADGTGLSEAMAQHPRAFDELAVGMIKAGQEGGFLEDVLRRIAEFTEHQEDLKAKVIGALAYPVFLAGAGFLVLNILVLFVVPAFKPMFQKLEDKGELPGLTSALIGASQFLQGNWYWLLGLAVGGFIVFRRWVATENGRMRMDALRLRLPGFGHIHLSLAIARFTRILGTMLHNGIPILQALRIAKDSSGNRVMAKAIEKSAENLKAGDSLAGPLAASKLFPRDVIEIVAVGEESNNLEKVLIDIATGLEKRTTRQLDLFVRLLEPVMLLVMAVMTLIVVAGLLMPIFKISQVVG